MPRSPKPTYFYDDLPLSNNTGSGKKKKRGYAPPEILESKDLDLLTHTLDESVTERAARPVEERHEHCLRCNRWYPTPLMKLASIGFTPPERVCTFCSKKLGMKEA